VVELVWSIGIEERNEDILTGFNWGRHGASNGEWFGMDVKQMWKLVMLETLDWSNSLIYLQHGNKCSF
jgi:hypothetical protein